MRELKVSAMARGLAMSFRTPASQAREPDSPLTDRSASVMRVEEDACGEPV